MFDPASVRITCIALLICGALFGGAGVAFHVRGHWLAGAVAEGGAQAEAACLAAARRLGSGVGGSVAATPDGLLLLVPETNDQRTSLTDASGLLASCPDMALSYFCMGRGCGSDGKVSMRMELRRQ